MSKGEQLTGANALPQIGGLGRAKSGSRWSIADWSSVRRHGIAVGLMCAATLMALPIRSHSADHSAITILYLVAVLTSAWLGYGPGTLACLLGLFVAPFFFSPAFDPRKVDLIRAALVVAVSNLISHTGVIQRKSNRLLESAYQTLDDKVRERTRELEETNRKLQRLNNALNEFAYSASHDLQQPLRTMATQSQLLSRRYAGKLDDEAEEFIQNIVQGARQMGALLTDLLAYSRSINAPPEEIPETDTARVLQDTISALQAQIDESLATIVVPGQLPCVRMHRFHLQELFQNLISNAIKYRSESAPTIEIDFRTEPIPYILVADNGIGIEPRDAAQIFGLFKRLNSSRICEGTGVGLAICQAIVDHYEGRIWVEPNVPVGSIFCFSVPLSSDSSVPG